MHISSALSFTLNVFFALLMMKSQAEVMEWIKSINVLRQAKFKL